MFKVLAVLAVAAVVLGLGVHYGRDQVVTAVHDRIDTGLPDEVEAHSWAPLRRGRPVRADRVRFVDGSVRTARCHATLGSYSVHIDHGFAFQPASTTTTRTCPGAWLRSGLLRASWVGVEDHGKGQRLIFTDGKGHTVATLQGRGN